MLGERVEQVKCFLRLKVSPGTLGERVEQVKCFLRLKVSPGVPGAM